MKKENLIPKPQFIYGKKHSPDPVKQLERRRQALAQPLYDYLTYLKQNPHIMVQYQMSFDFAGLLKKCLDTTYTFYDFMVDCRFDTIVTNHDMSLDEIEAWTIPGDNEGADVDALRRFFWSQQFQDQYDLVENTNQYLMSGFIQYYALNESQFDIDLRTSALAGSNKSNPYIVNLF